MDHPYLKIEVKGLDEYATPTIVSILNSLFDIIIITRREEEWKVLQRPKKKTTTYIYIKSTAQDAYIAIQNNSNTVAHRGKVIYH